MKFGALPFTLLILTMFSSCKTVQFIAKVNKQAVQEFGCEFARTSVYSIQIPTNTSSNLFQKSLRMTVGLPAGSSFASKSLKVSWNSSDVDVDSIDEDNGVITFQVLLKSGAYNYELVLWNTNNSIVNPFSLEKSVVSFRIDPVVGADSIYGETVVEFSQKIGRKIITSELRSILQNLYHEF